MAICTGGHPDTPYADMPCQRRSERARGDTTPCTHKGGDIHPPCFPPGICSVELFRKPQPLEPLRDVTFNLIRSAILCCADLYFVSEQADVLAE
jgi:hypothetical protein